LFFSLIPVPGAVMRLCAVCGVVAGLAGCAAPPPTAHLDPFEDGNRRTHAFNQALDKAVIAPIAGGAGGALNSPVGAAIGNAGGNLGMPGDIVNKVAQGRLEDAVHNSWRFVINTTIGLGGLFDPATAMGLDRRKADFGGTLHRWGVGEGGYLVLPVLGPSTERDALGSLVDAGIDPVGFVLPAPEKYWATGIKVASKLGDRARFGDTVDSIMHESADSYAQLRLLYLQSRRFELGQEVPDDEFLDPYED